MFGYTATGKAESITYPDNSQVNFTYDMDDRLISMTDLIGTSSYTLDAADRLTSATSTHDFTVNYEYDELGNLTKLIYPSNNSDEVSVGYEYDILNRLIRTTNWLGESSTYEYDAAGRMTKMIQFNGTTTEYNYDAASRMVELQSSAGGRLINKQLFDLDANGNIIREYRDQPQSFDESQVTQVNYDYNDKRNRLLSTTGDRSDSFAYDFEGQLTNKNNEQQFEFDYEHRLMKIIEDGTQSSFHYDGTGNRLIATRDGVTTQYIYSAGGNLIAEADDDGNITRYYIYGRGLQAMEENGSTYTYHYNHLGSTIAISDQSQNIINQYNYSPYGIIMGESEQISQPFKYVGQLGIMVEPNGLYYMRARYYDPQVGRFIKEDPIGLGGGINFYAYVGGNPMNAVDPSGLCPSCIGAAANLIIDAGVSYATTGSYSWRQAGIALIAGATGGAAAQRISQITRLAGTTRQVGANALAGGSINVAAGAANGSDDHFTNFALGAAGSLAGSGLSALTNSADNIVFGARGTANALGNAAGAGLEAFVAGSGGLVPTNDSPSPTTFGGSSGNRSGK